MEISFKWIRFAIICLTNVSLISCFYPEYILEDACILGNETINLLPTQLGTVGTIVATSYPPYQTDKNCTLIIQPPSGMSVVLTVRKVDFRQPSIFCLDYLKVYHSDVLFSPTTLCRFKFDLQEKTSYTSKGKMKILYHVESKFEDGLGIEEGFSLTYTVVSEDLQDCLKDDIFMCDNGKCIPNSLTCDLKNNCGDRSDESKLLCDPLIHSYVLTDVLYGIVLCIFIVILVSSCVVLISRRRRRILESDSDSDEPTTRLTPYQAVHPSGFFICQNPAGPQQSKFENGFSNPCYPSGAPPPYTK